MKTIFLMRFALIAIAVSTFVAEADVANAQFDTIRIKSVAPPPGGATVKLHGITREDVEQIRQLVPGIERIVVSRRIDQQSARLGDRSRDVRIIGLTHDYELDENERLVRGRQLTKKDLALRNNVVIISEKLANHLFRDSNPIAQAIGVGHEYFTVVGVIETKRSYDLLIPLTTMRSRFGDTVVMRNSGTFEMRKYEVSELEVVVSKDSDVNQTRELIQQIFRKNHKVQDYEFSR